MFKAVRSASAAVRPLIVGRDSSRSSCLEAPNFRPARSIIDRSMSELKPQGGSGFADAPVKIALFLVPQNRIGEKPQTLRIRVQGRIWAPTYSKESGPEAFGTCLFLRDPLLWRSAPLVTSQAVSRRLFFCFVSYGFVQPKGSIIYQDQPVWVSWLDHPAHYYPAVQTGHPDRMVQVCRSRWLIFSSDSRKCAVLVQRPSKSNFIECFKYDQLQEK